MLEYNLLRAGIYISKIEEGRYLNGNKKKKKKEMDKGWP